MPRANKGTSRRKEGHSLYPYVSRLSVEEKKTPSPKIENMLSTKKNRAC